MNTIPRQTWREQEGGGRVKLKEEKRTRHIADNEGAQRVTSIRGRGGKECATIIFLYTAAPGQSFFNQDLKTVLDHQPGLGEKKLSPLPDWLHNLARGRAGVMVSLDTFRANFCLWRCITVHQRSRPDRTTIAARQLARASFRDCPPP